MDGKSEWERRCRKKGGEMKFFILLFFVVSSYVEAEPSLSDPLPSIAANIVSAPNRFDFQSLPIAQVVSMYYRESTKKQFVLCDDLLKDDRYVSVRAAGKGLDSAVVKVILATNGYEEHEIEGVLSVCKKHEIAASVTPVLHTFVYRAKNRDVAYLVDLLQTVVKGSFGNKRPPAVSYAVGGDIADKSVTTPFSSKSVSDTGDEQLIFTGTEEQTEKLKSLLEKIDVPAPAVVVKGVLYEVNTGNSNVSALQVFLNLLGGRIGVKAGSAVGENALTLNVGGLDALASMVSNDSRFKILTSPYVLAKSNRKVRLQVGQDVPVAGQIVIGSNGQTTQSTEYRSAGVILDVLAQVREEVTDLEVTQTVSNFVTTTAGKSTSPTLNKREISTALSIRDGETIVLGGLRDLHDESSQSGMWGFNFASSKALAESELLLVLEVKKVQQ